MLIQPSDFSKSRVLVVDDQEANVRLLEQLLQEAGYLCVTSTRSPQDVCALHLAHDYDLILLDLNMPQMDGFEVMAALTAAGAAVYLPVIVLTAEPAHKLRALQAGAKDFISKPFDLLEVRTRIHNMLEIRLLYRRLAEYNETLEQAVRERTQALIASEERFRRLVELGSDWYWEQNETGKFTHVCGPVQQMLGIRVTDLLGADPPALLIGWNEAERTALHGKMAARQPFKDFMFIRTDADGSSRTYRVSGEPMFDQSCNYTGYRGMGAEVRADASTASSGSWAPTVSSDSDRP